MALSKRIPQMHLKQFFIPCQQEINEKKTPKRHFFSLYSICNLYAYIKYAHETTKHKLTYTLYRQPNVL